VNEAPKKILVFHTAFIGDVILALPLAQRLRASFPEAHIAFVVIPTAANVLENHPAVNEVIIYDKRRRDRGITGILKLARRLRFSAFDIAIVPHRSLRSAVIGWLSKIPRRIGFSTSALSRLFTDVVIYEKDIHEIDRNLSLLRPLGITYSGNESPTLYASQNDKDVVNAFLANQAANFPNPNDSLVAIAPGSVWNTKRWPKEHFERLARMLMDDGLSIVLIGARDDLALCSDIRNALGGKAVNAAGMLTLLQSAELIQRCVVLVSNDSAPMHLATGVRTPVVAIFGATAPQFGFAPRGANDFVVEMHGLSCRPCAIHGGEKCPIKTFVCMKDLKPELAYAKVKMVADRTKSEAQ
jgi:heptosyltransferase II